MKNKTNDPNNIDSFLKSYTYCIESFFYIYKRFLHMLSHELLKDDIKDLSGFNAYFIYKLSLCEAPISIKHFLNTFPVFSQCLKNVSYNVQKLHKDGYITSERTNADKRLALIALTEKGHATVKIIEKILAEHEKELPMFENGFSGHYYNKSLKKLMEQLIKLYNHN